MIGSLKSIDQTRRRPAVFPKIRAAVELTRASTPRSQTSRFRARSLKVARTFARPIIAGVTVPLPGTRRQWTLQPVILDSDASFEKEQRYEFQRQ
jgi:hypothetical protein